MLEVVAAAEGITASDAVRQMIRRAYAERGVGVTAKPMAAAWEAFEREHRQFIERHRRATETSTAPPSVASVSKCLEELVEAARADAKKSAANVIESVATMYEREGLVPLQNRARDQEKGRKALDEHFNQLWSAVDRVVDELKAKR